MILMNDSEYYHEDKAAAMTEANVNEIWKEIQNNIKSDNIQNLINNLDNESIAQIVNNYGFKLDTLWKTIIIIKIMK